MQVYDLPYPIEATSYVIYDGYFYYIKVSEIISV